MCLSSVEAVYDNPSDLIVDGWKEFAGTIVPHFYNFGGVVKLDVWMRAAEVNPPTSITVPGGKTYKAGFHAYADEKAKPASASRRVYLRRITCAGDQDGKQCVIAQEMYVPSDPNGWPPKPMPPAPVPKKKIMDRIRRGRKP